MSSPGRSPCARGPLRFTVPLADGPPSAGLLRPGHLPPVEGCRPEGLDPMGSQSALSCKGSRRHVGFAEASAACGSPADSDSHVSANETHSSPLQSSQPLGYETSPARLPRKSGGCGALGSEGLCERRPAAISSVPDPSELSRTPSNPNRLSHVATRWAHPKAPLDLQQGAALALSPVEEQLSPARRAFCHERSGSAGRARPCVTSSLELGAAPEAVTTARSPAWSPEARALLRPAEANAEGLSLTPPPRDSSAHRLSSLRPMTEPSASPSHFRQKLDNARFSSQTSVETPIAAPCGASGEPTPSHQQRRNSFVRTRWAHPKMTLEDCEDVTPRAATIPSLEPLSSLQRVSLRPRCLSAGRPCPHSPG
eukprot:RCo013109